MSFWNKRHGQIGAHVHIPSQILDEESGAVVVDSVPLVRLIGPFQIDVTLSDGSSQVLAVLSDGALVLSAFVFVRQNLETTGDPTDVSCTLSLNAESLIRVTLLDAAYAIDDPLAVAAPPMGDFNNLPHGVLASLVGMAQNGGECELRARVFTHDGTDPTVTLGAAEVYALIAETS